MDFLPIMERRCTDAGATISYNTTVTQLIKDESGRVTGAVATKDDKTVGYTNARAVILCTGDYTMDPAMLAEPRPMADSENTFKGFLPLRHRRRSQAGRLGRCCHAGHQALTHRRSSPCRSSAPWAPRPAR